MSNEDQLNIELRKEILRRVLVIEHGVTVLLLFFLNTKKEDRKAISKKSSVLSFNKVNLLYDLDVIDSCEYQNLLLLSQFRNKFLHDIDCKSFSEAIYMFQEFNSQRGMGKKLLSFHSRKEKHKNEGTENDYKEAYFCLAEKLYDIISEKSDNCLDEKKENYIFVESLFSFYKKNDGHVFWFNNGNIW